MSLAVLTVCLRPRRAAYRHARLSMMRHANLNNDYRPCALFNSEEIWRNAGDWVKTDETGEQPSKLLKNDGRI